MVIKCPACGNWTEGTSKYCPVCGASLTEVLKDNREGAPAPVIDNPIESGPANRQTPSRVRPEAPADKAKKSLNKAALFIIGGLILIMILVSILCVGILRRVTSMKTEEHSAYTQPEDTGDIGLETIDEDPVVPDESDGAVTNEIVVQEGSLAGEEEPAADEAEDLSSSDAALLSAGYDYIETFPRAEAGQVLVDEKGILITFDSLAIDEYSELAAAITVENRTDRDLDLFVSDAQINTYEVGTYSYENLPAGSSVRASVEFYQNDLNLTRITNIGEIVLDFVFYDPETYEQVMEAEGRIVTDDFGAMDTSANDSGYELGNAEGIRIVAKSLEPADDFSDDQIILFYISNNSDRGAAVDINNFFLNGTETSVSLYTELKPGTQAVKYAYVSADELEYFSISRINEISLHAAAYDLRTYDPIVDFGTADLTVTYDE